MSGNVAPSSFRFPSNNAMSDGSGKAIRMEAPVSRAWKRASGYTKGTYYCLLACILFIYFGYRWLRWSHCKISCRCFVYSGIIVAESGSICFCWFSFLVASISLVCHTEECTFSITPHGWNGHHKVTFPRSQLVNVEGVKVTKAGDFVDLSPRLDNFHDKPRASKNKSKHNAKQSTSYKGPDQNGHYPSYRLTLRETSGEQTGDSVPGDPELSNRMKDTPLTNVKLFMDDVDGDRSAFTFILRKMNIYQSRRRVKSTVQKIDSYIKRRRHKLTVKESTPPSWQGILLLVVGIFGIVLTALIGQFSESDETPKRRQGGPGTRAQTPTDYKGKRPSVASAPRRSKAY
jgi:hypothetical protein